MKKDKIIELWDWLSTAAYLYFIIMLVADLMDSVLCCWLLFLALFVEGAGGLVIKFKYGLKWMSWFVCESLFSLVFSAVCLYLLCRFCALA